MEDLDPEAETDTTDPEAGRGEDLAAGTDTTDPEAETDTTDPEAERRRREEAGRKRGGGVGRGARRGMRRRGSISLHPALHLTKNRTATKKKKRGKPATKDSTKNIRPSPLSANTPTRKEGDVFCDVDIDNRNIGRIIFELYDDVVPLTCENFYSLCVGSHTSKTNGKPLHYKGSKFHRIIPQFMVQGGDVTLGNGRGGESIYGEKFQDENFVLKHEKPFLLSMANAGPDTNSSQFFLTTIVCDWLDNKHTVFGEVVEGKDVVKKIEDQGSPKGIPLTTVTISDCGGI